MATDALDHAPPAALRVELLIAAAGAAPGPLGAARWFGRPMDDGVELRSVVKAWTSAPDRSARAMRIGCGVALRNVRLATVVQGRTPVCSFPLRSGLLAAVRAGAGCPAPRLDQELYRAIRPGRGTSEPAVEEPMVRAVLRRAVDTERAWLRFLPDDAREEVTPGTLGHPWSTDLPTGGLLALVCVPATDRIADLRVGQALQQVRLLASARLGWRGTVVAGPVDAARVRRWDPLAGDGPQSIAAVLLAPHADRAPAHASGSAAGGEET